MPVFSTGKNFDDIQEAVLMPEDWYLMEITKDPEQLPNKVMKESGADAEKAGFNIVVKMKSISEDPEHNGRPFTIWLSLPNPTDEGEFVGGQPKEDWKLEQIAKVTAAFNGIEEWKTMEGDEVRLDKGMRAKFYVSQAVGLDGQTMRNEISLMNAAPKPA